MNYSRARSIIIAVCLACMAGTTSAYSLLSNEKGYFGIDIEAAYGIFDIDKNFNGTDNGSSWQEGYIKYGFSGQWQTTGIIYGAINAVSSATWGDGDPAGFTLGNERRTAWEEVYLGWRSDHLFPALGADAVDIAIGSKVVTLGDGFIINDDGLNMGNGVALLNRGGAYYLAARHAFHKTATISISNGDDLRGDIIYLKSNNAAQAKPEMAIANFEYDRGCGSLGLSWIHGLDIDKNLANDNLLQRKSMNIYSLRSSHNNDKNLLVSFEVARQYRNDYMGQVRSGQKNKDTAWYAEVTWAFNEMDAIPILTGRYSHYGKTWDSLFTGLNRGFGTWFQGEVAANYAGPFNSNTDVYHLGLEMDTFNGLKLGLLFFDFDYKPRNNADPDVGGRELDMYVEWIAHPHLTIIPIIGLYRPDNAINSGGSQQNAGNNIYMQLMMVANF